MEIIIKDISHPGGIGSDSERCKLVQTKFSRGSCSPRFACPGYWALILAVGEPSPGPGVYGVIPDVLKDFIMKCWGCLSTVSGMRFKHHPLLDPIENKWYRDYTMSSGAKFTNIWGGSGVQLAKAEGKVPVGLASSSLGQNSLVFRGLPCTEMPITCSRPLFTDHREMSVCVCLTWHWQLH